MPLYWRHCLGVLGIASIAVWSGARPASFPTFAPTATSFATIENEIDLALTEAARNALDKREGTIIILDPQTGRIRAVVNPQLAFENSYAPGSTIKPFTALAALQAGLINKDSRALCHEHYSRQDFATVCAHPRDLPPFDPAEAIAYSCNYYFGRLGEKLNEGLLSDTLGSFGFGKPTFINGHRDNQGQLLRGKSDPRNALGEGDHLQVTPIQLIMAYSALVNGGHLFTAGTEGVADFHVHERSQVPIASDQRSLIISGMRGAVIYGTAARAGLNSAGLNVFGKTGTSTPLKGFRSQGWFVGFVSDATSEPAPKPEDVKLAILVFLKRGHGADAARVSRTIFAEFARSKDQSAASFLSSPTTEPVKSNSEPAQNHTASSVHKDSSPSDQPVVSVHLVTENITRAMPLEDYVANVVATEGSTEDQPEALKALAVAVRSYALRNLGRHVKDGYDFCSTTHCQRYQAASDRKLETASRQQAELNARALAAVQGTSGEVLRDQQGSLVDSYFSASCGGMTANLQSLWGGNTTAYLRGVRDESCATMPHYHWTDVITAEQLVQALRSDERTDPGNALKDLTISRRDATGRAELIVIEGERRRVVRGWDFKIIVGRKLGWNWLKSSRFEVTRAGSNFVFRGSGFGHGLGLCQEGAHVMAQRGANYQRILDKYFPGTNISQGLAAQSHADFLWENGHNLTAGGSFQLAHATSRTTLSSEHFRVSYPRSLPQRDVERILGTLEGARTNLMQRVAAAGLALNQLASLEVFINETTGDFVGRTGQPAWAAAATRANLIEIQPVAVLKRRGVLETTLRHELVHIMVDKVGRNRAPRWLAEGAALYFAGEGPLMSRYTSPTRISFAEIDNRLTKASSAGEMRQAYAAAFVAVSGLVKANGEAALWRQIAGG
jgi:stage II sporulation protein D